MKREIDLAWAAGLFEGEGCASIHWHTDKRDGARYLKARLSLQSVDEDVIEKFKSIVGGKTCAPSKTSTGKPVFRWDSGARLETIRISGMLIPFLCERRTKKIKELVDTIRIREGTPRRIRKDKKP